MDDNDFNEVISSAQRSAVERGAGATVRRDDISEAIKSRHEVLHSVVHSTLVRAWRDLESAGVRSSVDTSTNARGEWQVVLRIADKPDAPALVFSVIMGLNPHLVASREYQTSGEEVSYDVIDDATPVEIAQIVSNYLSETLA